MRALSTKHRKEVLNGFRIVGNLLLGFVTMVLLLLGTSAIIGGETGRVAKAGAYLAYAAGLTILYITADRWKVWIAGFFGLPGLWNSWIVLSTGHALHWPYTPVLLRDRLFMVAFCTALFVLTYPSSKWRKQFDLINHLCLVAGVVAFFFSWAGVKNYCVPLLITLALFSVIRLRLATWNKTAQHRVTAERAR